MISRLLGLLLPLVIVPPDLEVSSSHAGRGSPEDPRRLNRVSKQVNTGDRERKRIFRR